jgi:D-alanyl-D-alanine carboxypeptidase
MNRLHRSPPSIGGTRRLPRPEASHGRAIIVVLGLICVACAAQSTGDAAGTAIAPAATISQSADAFELPAAQRLSELISGWRSRNDVPGAIVGMRLGDGEPLIVVDGEDVESGAPLAADGAFEIASITKTFTGALALDLIDAGELGLDDTIDLYVKGFPNGDRITIRQLLTHTSGLHPLWVEVGDTPYSQEISDLLLSDPEPFTPDSVLELVKDRPLQFSPGQGVAYSNVNTILLGEVIEAVTGSDLTTAYRERLLTPLGLDDTYYRPTEAGPRPLPGIYRWQNGEPESSADVPERNERIIMSLGGAAVGMVSTPDDLLDWGVAFLRDGASGREELSSSRFQVAPNGTALGVIPWSIDSGACVFGVECSGFDAVTGIGLGIGTSSMVAYFPRWDLTVVALKNTGFGMPPEVEDLVAQMMRSFFRQR